MDYKEIKRKRPWVRVLPNGMEITVTQADFRKEYEPTGHRINDPNIYKDIVRVETVPILDKNGEKTGEKKKYYTEYVPRCSMAYQQVITLKQVVHACGNDIQFELNEDNPTEEIQTVFSDFKKGWTAKDMDIAYYKTVKSVKKTGDGAIVCYVDNGVFGWKHLSFTEKDILYPHPNPVTGKLDLFARSFFEYDDKGAQVVEWLEVWDDKYLYRLKRGSGEVVTMIGDYGVAGYEFVTKDLHGFDRVPVAYYRDNYGPCWSFAQDSIDEYELSFSQMAHNNRAYGEPVLVFQGEGDNADFQHNLNGTIKAISMSADDKVSYLEAQSASDSYLKQLDTLEKLIYFQAPIVKTPELKSGDLPAAALKMLYSAAYEKAMCDAKDYKLFLNDLVELFSEGYGKEMKMTLDFASLQMIWFIEPYVHVNNTSVVSDLATAVNAGFLSKRTAAEKLETMYSTSSEAERLLDEMKMEGKLNEGGDE